MHGVGLQPPTVIARGSLTVVAIELLAKVLEQHLPAALVFADAKVNHLENAIALAWTNAFIVVREDLFQRKPVYSMIKVIGSVQGQFTIHLYLRGITKDILTCRGKESI